MALTDADVQKQVNFMDKLNHVNPTDVTVNIHNLS